MRVRDICDECELYALALQSSLVSAPVLRFAVGSTTGNVMPEPLEVWHQKKKSNPCVLSKKVSSD